MVGFAGLFLLSISACGNSESSSENSDVVSVDVFPVTVGDLTLDAQPVRVVSLSPSATEMLYAIGAGSQVVAVDDYSNYPAEAAALGTALSGFEPNVEATWNNFKNRVEPFLALVKTNFGLEDFRDKAEVFYNYNWYQTSTQPDLFSNL